MGVSDLLSLVARVGRDPETGGYNRFTYSNANQQMRAWFSQQAQTRGLDVASDGNGNLWATRGRGPYLATGSHLDSVSQGGAFDGPLGVAAAFAAVDLAKTKRDLAIVAFAEEEGARFGIPCLGSRLTAGAFDPERARALQDRAGVSLGAVMSATGLDPLLLGSDPKRLDLIEAFVEVHIEQGRGLVDLEAPLGVGESIWPHGRWRLDFHGTADHAGTTRMEDRTDPTLPFARLLLEVNEYARAKGLRATIGRIEVRPNGTNAIPSLVSAWLDARAATDHELDLFIARLPGDENMTVTNESRSPGVTFHPDLSADIGRLLDHPPVLPTAAGHDAGVLASYGIPAAMIFVRNPTGVSHSPAEFASAADCEIGAQALAAVFEGL